MSFTRLVRLASLVLAICIALAGQLRAADLIDLDDSDTITASTSDDFVATTTGVEVAPPRLRGAVHALPVLIGAGRIASVRLFRPPQAA